MNLNSILIGSDDPARLVDYYKKVLGAPTWEDGGFTTWVIGSGAMSVGAHDQVHGKNTAPGRIIWNIETPDVQAEAARFKAAGATVVAEPYHLGGGPDDPEGMPEGWIATFSDPDDNYFQLMSPMAP